MMLLQSTRKILIVLITASSQYFR